MSGMVVSKSREVRLASESRDVQHQKVWDQAAGTLLQQAKAACP